MRSLTGAAAGGDEAMTGKLRERVQAIVNRWDDDKNNYRGRAILLSLKAALLAEQAPAGEFVLSDEQHQRIERIKAHVAASSHHASDTGICDCNICFLLKVVAAGRSSQPAEPRDPAAK